MAPVIQNDPQSANAYDDRTTAAVKSVIVEIGQILGSFEGKFAIIGGVVPWLLLNQADNPHIGTADVDLSLDSDALGDGEYAQLVEALQDNGYQQRDNMKRFQLIRTVPAVDGGQDIDIVVDFLMPRDAEIIKNDPPVINEFAVQRADGAELALKYHEVVMINNVMPDGGTNNVSIAVASIPALLAMKGFAINNRLKRKDAYDIYYCIRNFPGGMNTLVEACLPLLENEEARVGYAHIRNKFDSVNGFGPTSVRQFVENSDALGGLTPDQWQQDAFGQVDAWLKAMGLR